MFLPNGDFDWTYYYSELAKAKSERIMWFAVGVVIGFILTFTVPYLIRIF